MPETSAAVRWIGCPQSNFHRGRPAALRPEAIVIHVMDGSFAAGESVFLDPSTQRSAHYGISHAGDVHQYVDEKNTAFHAGTVVRPTWSLLKLGVNPNFYTIGIEHEGTADEPWTASQMTSSSRLISEIASRWNIPLDLDHVIRHHEIRASKTCPGNWMQDLSVLLPEPAAANELSQVRLRTNVNLRSVEPKTSAPILRVLSAGLEISVRGVVIGDAVSGNAYWYVDGNGNFFWSGAACRSPS